MKISHTWLKEYIDTRKSLEETAKLLTMSGSEVKVIDKLGGDFVMDIEITPNRSDCLSYIGIARELAALTGKKIKMPLFKVKGKGAGKAPFTPLEISKTLEQKTESLTGFTVEIKDEDLCPRYTARLIRDIKVSESPDWLKKRIVSIGLRPVNNVADITNYVLFELGQPMHAFDYDKIKGSSVIIRRAKSGERITTIDQEKRPLDKDMLIIADQERPIAIGGVMGGLDTEVSSGTKNILLESAYFNPISVRRTSFKLGLISESSYRFERGVDPQMVLPASDRTALLIAETCGGKIGELVDKGSQPGKDRTISLRIARLNKILNLELKESYVKKVFSGLCLKATSPKKGSLKVAVPSFRGDLKDEIDLIEEVARIYGYEDISMTIPRIISNPERKSISWKAREKARDILTSLGVSEVVTYSMTSKGNMQKFSDFDAPEKTIIGVKNYLSFDQEIMRTSLIPGIVGALNWNINRGIKDIKIFEISKVYGKDYCSSEDCRYERTNLCIALTGLYSSDWQRPKSKVTFFDLKGLLEALSRELGLKDFTIAKQPNSPLAKDVSSDILYKGKRIGIAGRLAREIQDAFDLRQEVFLAEVDFDAVADSVNLEKKFTDIPKFPSIKRDISLAAGEDASFANIRTIVAEEGKGFVEKIELLEEYTGKQTAGQRGLSFRIEYRDKYKTLTAEEVDKLHSAIRKSLAEKLDVTLR